MQERYVITITRQFGSLGRPIAREMAKLLDIDYYDRDIVEMAEKEMQQPVSVVRLLRLQAASSFCPVSQASPRLKS